MLVDLHGKQTSLKKPKWDALVKLGSENKALASFGVFRQFAREGNDMLMQMANVSSTRLRCHVSYCIIARIAAAFCLNAVALLFAAVS